MSQKLKFSLPPSPFGEKGEKLIFRDPAGCWHHWLKPFFHNSNGLRAINVQSANNEEKKIRGFSQKGPDKKFSFYFFQYAKTGEFEAVQTVFIYSFKNLEFF